MHTSTCLLGASEIAHCAHTTPPLTMVGFKQGKDTIHLDHCVKEQNIDHFGAEWGEEWGVG